MSAAVEKLLFTYLWNRYHQQIPGKKVNWDRCNFHPLMPALTLVSLLEDIWCWKLPCRVGDIRKRPPAHLIVYGRQGISTWRSLLYCRFIVSYFASTCCYIPTLGTAIAAESQVLRVVEERDYNIKSLNPISFAGTMKRYYSRITTENPCEPYVYCTFHFNLNFKIT
jgi:hypothetical protein